MMRSALLWASENKTLRETVPKYRFAKAAVKKFMPGETVPDALREGTRLNGMGAGVIFTRLGENVLDKTAAQEVADLATQMEERSQHFFELWDQHLASVQNEDIRERSAKRREEVAENFKKIKSEYTEVRDEFKPLLADLRDVRTVLGTDLTLSGIKTVEDTVEDIEDEQEDVRESLQELAAKFRELGVDLSRAGPAVEAAVDAKK